MARERKGEEREKEREGREGEGGREGGREGGTPTSVGGPILLCFNCSDILFSFFTT